jgi:hypothetical protein
MAYNRNRRVSSAGRFLDRVRAGGKKTAVACALVAIMLFMWVRVLIGHRPAAAEAAPPPKPAETSARTGPVAVTLVELPKSPGRHAAIARDFFVAQDGSYARRNGAGRNTGTEKEVPAVSSTNVEEVIRRAAQTLKLDAVFLRDNPQAFLNDQPLGVGDKLTVKDGTASYEFEVLKIYMDSVLVGCNGIQLTLKLAQVSK